VSELVTLSGALGFGIPVTHVAHVYITPRKWSYDQSSAFRQGCERMRSLQCQQNCWECVWVKVEFQQTFSLSNGLSVPSPLRPSGDFAKQMRRRTKEKRKWETNNTEHNEMWWSRNKDKMRSFCWRESTWIRKRKKEMEECEYGCGDWSLWERLYWLGPGDRQVRSKSWAWWFEPLSSDLRKVCGDGDRRMIWRLLALSGWCRSIIDTHQPQVGAANCTHEFCCQVFDWEFNKGWYQEKLYPSVTQHKLKLFCFSWP
jgi:hypothetical protein